MSKPRAKPPANKDIVLAVKGFDQNLQCKGYQFVIGQTYEHNGKVVACESGFHACENPLDVWSYYGPCESRFALVELSGEFSRHEADSKIAAARITIKAELSLPDFIGRAVSWLIEHIKSGEKASGHYSQLAASGDSSRLAASGKNSVIASSAISAIAKGADGTWLSLAEFGGDGKCVGFATGCIGRDGLKPDTWYRANGGKLVETTP